MSANQPTAAWGGPGDPLVVVAGHLVSPEDGFGEIGRMPNGNLRRPSLISVLGNISLTTVSDAAGTAPLVLLSRARGTVANPTGVLNGDSLGGNFYLGHDGTAFAVSARIQSRASENWSAIAHGAALDFATVAPGTTSVANRWQIQGPGHFVTDLDNTVDIGLTGSRRPRDFFLARNAVIGGALDHDGTTVGFYGTVPIAQQVGVAVTAAGIHAACVALGLFTA